MSRSNEVFKIENVFYVQSLGIAEKFEKTLPYYQMYFIRNGCASVETDDYTGPLDRNQIILIKPNTKYSIVAETAKTSAISIGFSCETVYLKPFEIAPFTVSVSIQNHLFRALKESSFLSQQPGSEKLDKKISPPFGSEQLLYQNLEYFFIMLIRKSQLNIDFSEAQKYPSHHKDELASSIVEYIDNHINENLNNFSICTQFGINKTTLCNLFRETQGCTLIKYINQAKIQVAKSMIRDGEKNFTQIADALSFSSIHYFCKVFIKYERMTPTEYSKIVTSYIEKN